MSERPVNLLLDDILEAIDRVEQYVKGLSFDTFSKDRKTVDAVARNLEIIGEAANRLPDEFKEKHSGNRMAQSRGIASQDYPRIFRHRPCDYLANTAKGFAFAAKSPVPHPRVNKL